MWNPAAGADLAARPDLLAREPATVGEGEFELVAVELCAGRAQTRRDFGQRDPADARQLVADLFGLEAQLLPVGQVLPLAAAADAEMLAEGLLAQRRPLHVTHDETFHVAAAFRPDLHVHDVARHGHRHEDHHVLPTPHRLAFGGERRYLEPLDQGVIRFLSCHFDLCFAPQS